MQIKHAVRNARPLELRIATAGWTIPRDVAASFAQDGSGLERYAARFNAVEVNTTFYRSHRANTYGRWAQSTPRDFRFAVKLPRTITHHARLVGVDKLLDAFRTEVAPLGEKLGPLLVQLPPSLAFEFSTMAAFFQDLRHRWPETIVCEPRHPSWFTADAEALLIDYDIARVAADPAPHPAAATPGGCSKVAYWRLHGSPRMYYSSYDEPKLSKLALKLSTSAAREIWCVFDNTASGAAASNAVALQSIMDRQDSNGSGTAREAPPRMRRT